MSQFIEKTETGSTNDDAKDLARNGAPQLTVVWAHRQTAGRGRHDRKWVSNEGNVFWSIILRPDRTWPRLTDIVYVNALAVHRTVSSHTEGKAEVALKWPNDVLLNGKKVAGSLLESGGFWTEDKPEWLVVGTGINVVEFPAIPDIRYPATSLHDEGFTSTSREVLVKDLKSNLAAELNAWIADGFASTKSRYLSLAYGLGSVIRVGLSSDKSNYTEGVYKGVDDAGRLLLEVAPNEIRQFDSADVLLVNKD